MSASLCAEQPSVSSINTVIVYIVSVCLGALFGLKYQSFPFVTPSPENNMFCIVFCVVAVNFISASSIQILDCGVKVIIGSSKTGIVISAVFVQLFASVTEYVTV